MQPLKKTVVPGQPVKKKSSVHGEFMGIEHQKTM